MIGTHQFRYPPRPLFPQRIKMVSPLGQEQDKTNQENNSPSPFRLAAAAAPAMACLPACLPPAASSSSSSSSRSCSRGRGRSSGSSCCRRPPLPQIRARRTNGALWPNLPTHIQIQCERTADCSVSYLIWRASNQLPPPLQWRFCGRTARRRGCSKQQTDSNSAANLHG